MVGHPNFIEISVQGGSWVETFTASRKVYGDSEYEDTRPASWTIPETCISEPAEVWGLRLLLDEIERRMDDE